MQHSTTPKKGLRLGMLFFQNELQLSRFYDQHGSIETMLYLYDERGKSVGYFVTTRDGSQWEEYQDPNDNRYYLVPFNDATNARNHFGKPAHIVGNAVPLQDDKTENDAATSQRLVSVRSVRVRILKCAQRLGVKRFAHGDSAELQEVFKRLQGIATLAGVKPRELEGAYWANTTLRDDQNVKHYVFQAPPKVFELLRIEALPLWADIEKIKDKRDKNRLKTEGNTLDTNEKIIEHIQYVLDDVGGAFPASKRDSKVLYRIDALGKIVVVEMVKRGNKYRIVTAFESKIETLLEKEKNTNRKFATASKSGDHLADESDSFRVAGVPHSTHSVSILHKSIESFLENQDHISMKTNSLQDRTQAPLASTLTSIASTLSHKSPEVFDAYVGRLQSIATLAGEEVQIRRPIRSVVGNVTTVLTPQRTIKARYALVPSDDLITSHEPTANFKKDPRYPIICENQRAYHNTKPEQEKVREIARNIIPEELINTSPQAVSGPPIISPEGFVLGGNGRTMGFLMSENVAGYNDYLAKNLTTFGITEKPKGTLTYMLVRIADISMKECAAISNLLNEGLIQEQDVVSKGISLVRQMSESDIAAIGNIFEAEDVETFAQIFDNPLAARKLEDILRKVGIITPRNVGRFLDDKGQFTAEGKMNAEAILLGIVVQDKTLLETARKYTAHILKSLPMFVRMRRFTGEQVGWNITQEVLDAIQLESSRRASGMNKADFLDQDALFATTRPDITERTRLVWGALDTGARSFSVFIRDFVEAAESSTKQDDFFAAPLQPIEVLRRYEAQLKRKGLGDGEDNLPLQLQHFADLVAEKGVLTRFQKRLEGIATLMGARLSFKEQKQQASANPSTTFDSITNPTVRTFLKKAYDKAKSNALTSKEFLTQSFYIAGDHNRLLRHLIYTELTGEKATNENSGMTKLEAIISDWLWEHADLSKRHTEQIQKEQQEKENKKQELHKAKADQAFTPEQLNEMGLFFDPSRYPAEIVEQFTSRKIHKGVIVKFTPRGSDLQTYGIVIECFVSTMTAIFGGAKQHSPYVRVLYRTNTKGVNIEHLGGYENVFFNAKEFEHVFTPPLPPSFPVPTNKDQIKQGFIERIREQSYSDLRQQESFVRDAIKKGQPRNQKQAEKQIEKIQYDLQKLSEGKIPGEQNAIDYRNVLLYESIMQLFSVMQPEQYAEVSKAIELSLQPHQAPPKPEPVPVAPKPAPTQATPNNEPQKQSFSAAETAKLILRDLAEAFPGQKFTTTFSKRIGGHVTVSYLDGPLYEDVLDVVQKYQNADFDGMTDMTTYRKMGFPLKNLEGKTVQFYGGARYVNVSRRFSRNGLQKIIAAFDPSGQFKFAISGNDFNGYEAEIQPYNQSAQFWFTDTRNKTNFYTPPQHTPTSQNTATPRSTTTPSTTEIRHNTKMNGIEIVFPAKPEQGVIDMLKREGFRWSGRGGLWYCKHTSTLMEKMKKHFGIEEVTTLSDYFDYEGLGDFFGFSDSELEPLLQSAADKAAQKGILSRFKSRLEGIATLAGINLTYKAEHKAKAPDPNTTTYTDTNAHDTEKALAEAEKRYDHWQEMNRTNEMTITTRLREIDTMSKKARKEQYPGYFPTKNENVLLEAVAAAEIEPGMRVLEPSAGTGNIADAGLSSHPDSIVDCIELVDGFREILSLKGHTLIGDDFLSFAEQGVYDRIVMNPPFELMNDIRHTEHAYKLVKPGGIVVSIVADRWNKLDQSSGNPVVERFTKFIRNRGTYTALPEDSFKSSDTSVRTRLVVIRKPLVELDDMKQKVIETTDVNTGDYVEHLISGEQYQVILSSGEKIVLLSLETQQQQTLTKLREDEFTRISETDLLPNNYATAKNTTTRSTGKNSRSTDAHSGHGAQHGRPDAGGTGNTQLVQTDRTHQNKQGSTNKLGTERFEQTLNVVRREYTYQPTGSEIDKISSELLGNGFDKLFDYQQTGIVTADRALEQFGGFLNADATGVGKTNQILLLAHLQAKRHNKPVLIVTLTDGAYIGENASFVKASKMHNIPFQVFNGSVKGSGVYICRYYDIKAERFKKEMEWDMERTGRDKNGRMVTKTVHYKERRFPHFGSEFACLIFDESHQLINESTGWTVEALRLNEECERVAFFSATPLEKVPHIHYLAPLKIWRSEEQLQKLIYTLGYEYYSRVTINKKTGAYEYSYGYTKRKNFPDELIGMEIDNIFEDLTQDGKMMKREFIITDLDIQTVNIELPMVAKKSMDVIADYWIFEAANRKMPPGAFNGVIMMEQKREVESYKVRYTLQRIHKELSEGRSVLVFVEGINDAHDDSAALGKRRKSTLRYIVEACERAYGVGAVAEIHGGVDEEERAQNQIDFQTNTKRIAILSPGIGAASINLDDTTGDAPRTMIVVTPPFKAITYIQMIGRISRATTKSKPRVVNLIGDVDVELAIKKIFSGKLKTLIAAVQGAIESVEGSDMDMSPDDETQRQWNYFAGLRNIVAAKKRFTELAKTLHPDTSGYDSAAEFREMNEEWIDFQEWLKTQKIDEREYNEHPLFGKTVIRGKDYGFNFNAEVTTHRDGQTDELIRDTIIIKALRGDYLPDELEKTLSSRGYKGYSQKSIAYTEDEWRWVINLFIEKQVFFESEEQTYKEGDSVRAVQAFTDNFGQSIPRGTLGTVRRVREKPSSPSTSYFTYEIDWNLNGLTINSKRVMKDNIEAIPKPIHEMTEEEFVTFFFTKKKDQYGTPVYVYLDESTSKLPEVLSLLARAEAGGLEPSKYHVDTKAELLELLTNKATTFARKHWHEQKRENDPSYKFQPNLTIDREVKISSLHYADQAEMSRDIGDYKASEVVVAGHATFIRELSLYDMWAMLEFDPKRVPNEFVKGLWLSTADDKVFVAYFQNGLWLYQLSEIERLNTGNPKQMEMPPEHPRVQLSEVNTSQDFAAYDSFHDVGSKLYFRVFPASQLPEVDGLLDKRYLSYRYSLSGTAYNLDEFVRAIATKLGSPWIVDNDHRVYAVPNDYVSSLYQITKLPPSARSYTTAFVEFLKGQQLWANWQDTYGKMKAAGITSQRPEEYFKANYAVIVEAFAGQFSASQSKLPSWDDIKRGREAFTTYDVLSELARHFGSTEAATSLADPTPEAFSANAVPNLTFQAEIHPTDLVPAPEALSILGEHVQSVLNKRRTALARTITPRTALLLAEDMRQANAEWLKDSAGRYYTLVGADGTQLHQLVR